MTLAEFLTQSATEVMAVNPGQNLSGAQTEFWRKAFNDLAQSLSVDRLLLFFVTDVQYTLANSQEAYQIGPGGVPFDTTSPGSPYVRPLFVESARSLIGNSYRKSLNMRTEQEFAIDPWRGATHPDGPFDFYYAANVKLGVFNFAPKPHAGQVVFISQWNPLPTFNETQLSEEMTDWYPAEYVRMLRLLLAIEKAPAYGQRSMAVAQGLQPQAVQATQLVRQLNAERLKGSVGESGTLSSPAIGIGQPINPQQ